MLSLVYSEHPTDGIVSESKRRCRFALKFLHRYVAKIKLPREPKQHPSFMSSLLNQSDFSEIEEAPLEHSRKSSDDDLLLLSPGYMKEMMKHTSLW